MPHDPEAVRAAVADFERNPTDEAAWAVVPAARRAWVEVFTGAPDGPVRNSVTDALAAALDDAHVRLSADPARSPAVREVAVRMLWYRLLLRSLRTDGPARVVRLLEFSREQFDRGATVADVTTALRALIPPDTDMVIPVPAVIRAN